MRNVSPSHKNQMGTDCGWPLDLTVEIQAISSSRSRLSARAPVSVVVSSIELPFPYCPWPIAYPKSHLPLPEGPVPSPARQRACAHPSSRESTCPEDIVTLSYRTASAKRDGS